MIKLLASILLALYLLPVALNAQSTIVGYVFDSSSVSGYFVNPTDGWPVYLFNNGDIVATQFTQNLYYHFVGVPPDTYEVAIVRNHLWKRDSTLVIAQSGYTHTRNFRFRGYPEANGNNINNIGDLTYMTRYFMGDPLTPAPNRYGDYNNSGSFNGIDQIYFYNILQGGARVFVVNDPAVMARAHFLADPGLSDSVLIIPDRNEIEFDESFNLDIYFTLDDSVPAFEIPITIPPGFQITGNVNYLFQPAWPSVFTKTYSNYPHSGEMTLTLCGFFHSIADTLYSPPLLPSGQPIHIASIPLRSILGARPGDNYFTLGNDSIQGPPVLGHLSGISEWIPKSRSEAVRMIYHSSINGVVLNDSLQPVPGVNIHLWGNGYRHFNTGFDGSYSFDNVAPGIYSFYFYHPGYADTSVSGFVVPLDQNIILNMTLRPHGFVLIYGQRNCAPIPVEIGDTLEIPAWGATPAGNNPDTVTFMHMPLASNDSVIVARLGGYFPDTLVGNWDDRTFLTPRSLGNGWTNQSMIAYAYLGDPPDPQYWFWTDGDTVPICTFKIRLAFDTTFIGDTICPFRNGYDPHNDSLLWGIVGGSRAFVPATTFPRLIVLPPSNSCDYLLGDVNDDDLINGIDILFAVDYFKGGVAPPDRCACPPIHYPFFASGDVNASCAFNGVDILYMINCFRGHGPEYMPCRDCPQADLIPK